MAKRNHEFKEPYPKQAYVAPVSNAGRWLLKHIADEAALMKWNPTPLQMGDHAWEESLYIILAEEYSCFDAKVVSVSNKKGATAVNLSGVCPHHGYAHRSNHWALINTDGYDTTLFICHHDQTRRLINAKMPF